MLARYPAGAELVWAQEEPRNMGAWRFVREEFLDRVVPGSRTGACRATSAARPAPAPRRDRTRRTSQEQEAIVEAALSDPRRRPRRGSPRSQHAAPATS